MRYRPRIWHAVLAAAPALALAACASTAPAPSAHAAAPTRSVSAAPSVTFVPPTPIAGGLPEVHDPGQVTGTLTGPCHTTGIYPDQLPDPRCTPGSIDPAVTQASIHQTVCVRGYTTKVRPPEAQTEAFKFGRAYPAYGVAHSVRTELDHQVPLELGGSNDAKNLWPEPETSIPNAKDYVEDAARVAVCSGRMTLASAQIAIAKNWVSLGQQLGVKTPRSADVPAAVLPVTARPAVTHAAVTHAAAPVTRTAAPPVTHAAPVSHAAAACHPQTSGGNCYEPGEFCSKAEHNESGVAGDGKPITCEPPSSGTTWRWED